MLCEDAKKIIALLTAGNFDPKDDLLYREHLQTCESCGGTPYQIIRADRFVEKKEEKGFWATLVKSR